jgi:hypothetical protein
MTARATLLFIRLLSAPKSVIRDAAILRLDPSATLADNAHVSVMRCACARMSPAAIWKTGGRQAPCPVRIEARRLGVARRPSGRVPRRRSAEAGPGSRCLRPTRPVAS